MRITLIDGAGSGPASDRLVAALGIRASEIDVHRLSEERIAPCRGCFECWTDHPGVCHTRDDANALLESMMASDVVAFVTRPRFGTWDVRTKTVLDRSVGLLSPMFEMVEGETHHKARYERYPRWVVFAIGGGRAESRNRFRALVRRNVVNLHTQAPWVGFFDEEAPLATLDAAAGEALRHIDGETPQVDRPQHIELLHREGIARSNKPRHVLVWVGSPKALGTSTSEAMGRALGDRLVQRGWTMEVLGGLPGAKHPERLVAAVERSDLVIPAAPVYVDSLPAIVLEGLAQIVDQRFERRTAWLPIVQCGFPELSHTVLPLRQFQEAVGERGDAWVGHLATGEGEFYHGRAPGQCGRPARHQAAALDDAAEAIDVGLPLPPDVIERFGKSPLPGPVYRTAGTAGFLWRAWRRGALDRLDEQPFRPGLGD